jgi:hypothetical protein
VTSAELDKPKRRLSGLSDSRRFGWLDEYPFYGVEETEVEYLSNNGYVILSVTRNSACLDMSF